MSDLELSDELVAFKNAFSRGVDMIGSVKRAADLLSCSVGQITKWRSTAYPDRIPGDLFPRIDAAARYPVMLEVYAQLAGYSIRKDEVAGSNMPLCALAGAVAAASGRALQTTLDADADLVITPREFNCIEAEGKTAITDVNRMIDAARAKCEANVFPMKAASR